MSVFKAKRLLNFISYCESLSSNRQLSKSLTDILLAMPKEPTHAITMKAQRLKIKEKGQKYPPGNVVLQVLGSGAKGAPRSLYLFTDQSRYLFNCGEGTQRLAHEHKMKLSKLEHIFVTRGTWENVGGLPGVILTIQDVGVPEITLHGPPGIEQIFTATKRFIVLKNLALKSASSRPEHLFEDNAIKVNYIPIFSEKSNKSDSEGSEGSVDDDIDYYDHAVGNNGVANEATNNVSSERVNKSRPNKNCVMCFAVRLQPRPGSLCLNKCVEAGVPPGPLLGRLKAGEDIVLVNGTVVRSADVTMPADPGPVFIVVECPDESFLDALVEEPSFEKYQLGHAKDDEMPVLIVHFTPTHILQSEKYRKWMDKFALSTFHLVLNEDNSCMGSISVHRIQHKLNLLDPSIFPLLEDIPTKESTGTTPNSECSSEAPIQPDGSSPLERNFNISKAKTFCNFSLRPKKTLDNRLKVIVEPDEYKEEVMKIDGFSTELTKLESITENSSETMIRDHPKITFLGTGSCIPNKTRNTSGILMNISEDKSMLIDCGEGTYGQLVRLHGSKHVDSVLKNIKAVYISHLHADHHIGLIGVLKGLAKAGNDGVVYLIAPKQIMFWLNFYDKNFERILDRVHLIPNQAIQFKDYNLDESIRELFHSDLGMDTVQTCYVKHCPNAFGVSFKHRDGWKIAYSGDTMPCDDFVELGRDCDLLIHEATMEDELKEEAIIKLHSTTSEAIDVGRKMGAKFTMLTHFSQRYAKLPRLGESGSFGDNVGIAFDNMRVRLSDLSKLGKFNPALLLMFQEDVDELETKAFKRQMKQERETKKKQKILTG